MKKWIITFACAAIILPPLSLWFQAMSTPNYDGGDSYVSYSPDGKYKMDIIHSENSTRTILLLTDLNEDTIASINYIPSNCSVSRLVLWICQRTGSRKKKCTGYSYGDQDRIISIPPSWWDRMEAKLATSYKHLDKAQLNVIKVHEWYPPVPKKSRKAQ